jgi:hypothetical protein
VESIHPSIHPSIHSRGCTERSFDVQCEIGDSRRRCVSSPPSRSKLHSVRSGMFRIRRDNDKFHVTTRRSSKSIDASPRISRYESSPLTLTLASFSLAARNEARTRDDERIPSDIERRSFRRSRAFAPYTIAYYRRANHSSAAGSCRYAYAPNEFHQDSERAAKVARHLVNGRRSPCISCAIRR